MHINFNEKHCKVYSKINSNENVRHYANTSHYSTDSTNPFVMSKVYCQFYNLVKQQVKVHINTYKQVTVSITSKGTIHIIHYAN